jgi:hypothetical protein
MSIHVLVHHRSSSMNLKPVTKDTVPVTDPRYRPRINGSAGSFSRPLNAHVRPDSTKFVCVRGVESQICKRDISSGNSRTLESSLCFITERNPLKRSRLFCPSGTRSNWMSSRLLSSERGFPNQVAAEAASQYPAGRLVTGGTWRAKEAWSRDLALGFVHVRLVPDALVLGLATMDDYGIAPGWVYLLEVVYVGAERERKTRSSQHPLLLLLQLTL